MGNVLLPGGPAGDCWCPLVDLDMEPSVCPPVERPRKDGRFLSFCCRGPCSAADKSKVQKWHAPGGCYPSLGSLIRCAVCPLLTWAAHLGWAVPGRLLLRGSRRGLWVTGFLLSQMVLQCRGWLPAAVKPCLMIIKLLFFTLKNLFIFCTKAGSISLWLHGRSLGKV